MTHPGEPTQAADPPAAAVAHARWFRVLADPTRLAILNTLLTGPHSVSELTHQTGLPRSRVSNHLAYAENSCS